MTRLEIIGWGEVSGRRARLQPCRKALIESIQCGTKGEPQISAFRYALSTERSGVERSAVLSNLQIRGEGR
jgi:hypothetical protein